MISNIYTLDIKAQLSQEIESRRPQIERNSPIKNQNIEPEID